MRTITQQTIAVALCAGALTMMYACGSPRPGDDSKSGGGTTEGKVVLPGRGAEAVPQPAGPPVTPQPDKWRARVKPAVAVEPAAPAAAIKKATPLAAGKPAAAAATEKAKLEAEEKAKAKQKESAKEAATGR